MAEEEKMPIYRYVCSECGHEFTELRKVSERTNPIACPQCGGQASFVFSTFAIELVTSTGIAMVRNRDGSIAYYKKRDWDPPIHVLEKFKNNIVEYNQLINQKKG